MQTRNTKKKNIENCRELWPILSKTRFLLYTSLYLLNNKTVFCMQLFKRIPTRKNFKKSFSRFSSKDLPKSFALFLALYFSFLLVDHLWTSVHCQKKVSKLHSSFPGTSYGLIRVPPYFSLFNFK